MERNNISPFVSGIQYTVLYDKYMNAWLVDTNKGIKSEWGSVVTGWKEMSEQELETSTQQLSKYRQATQEETQALLKAFGLLD